MMFYDINENMIPKPSNENFFLHTHKYYEIYLFIEGDTSYIIEGKTYQMHPGDVIITRRNEMHRAYHNSSTPYSRIIINVFPEFFNQYHCEEYEEQFANAYFDIGNKIEASVVKSIGIYDAIMRLKRYTEDFENQYTPAAVAVITEILYLINNIDSFSEADNSDDRFHTIVNYINSNYTDEITLEELERKFFVSKFHLCRLFKKETGLTLHQYIIQKRFALIKELTLGGAKIGEASIAAGFSSYSVFYRAYLKEYGVSPTKNIQSSNTRKE